jgi:hypothetical protein
MSIARRLGVFAVVVCLTLTLLAGNVVVATHQTVLDPGFVTDSLAEEESYEVIHEEALSNDSLPIGDAESLPPFADNIVGQLITPEYIQSQTESNIERAYGYFHGSEDELVLVVDTRPIKDRADDAVASAVENTSTRELAEFAGFESGSFSGIDVNSSVLFGLSEGPEEFSQSRQEIRTVARDRLLDRLVDARFEQSSNDELLSLVIDNYDSEEYTDEEKAQMVSERESEIRAALRKELEAERGDEIDQTVTTLLNDSRSDVKAEYTTFDTGFGEEVDTAAGDLVGVYVDGLLAPDITYEEFSTELNAEKSELGAALGDAAQDRLDEAVADQLVLTDQLDAETKRNLVRARATVVLMDVLGWFLPLLALVLAGLIWVVSDEIETAALWTGVSAILAAVPGYAGGILATNAIQTQVSNAVPEEQAAVGDLAVGLVTQTFGTLSSQSLFLLIGGVLLTIAGAAVRLGLVDLDDSGGFDGSGGGSDFGGDSGRDTGGEPARERTETDRQTEAADHETAAADHETGEESGFDDQKIPEEDATEEAADERHATRDAETVGDREATDDPLSDTSDETAEDSSAEDADEADR